MLVKTGTQSGGTTLTLCDSDGNVIVSCVPETSYQCAVITSPKVSSGNKYTLYVGGEVAEADENGYADSGKLEGGNLLSQIEMTSSIYTDSGISMMDPGGMGGPGGMDGPGGMRPGDTREPGGNNPPRDSF